MARGGAAADRAPWDAREFAATLTDEFARAATRHRRRDAEHRYRVVAAYARRTLGIIRTALDDGDDALVEVTLHNFAALHDATIAMRRLAPRLVDDPALAGRHDRGVLLDDRILEEVARSDRPLTDAQLARRLADGGRGPDAEATLLAPHVDALIESGHLRRDGRGRLVRTGRRHVGVSRGAAALEVLVGPRLLRALHVAHIRTVHDVVDRPDSTAAVLGEVLASRSALDAFVDVARRLAAEAPEPARAGWPHDVAREYQLAAFEALRHHDFDGVVLDAPAGSGKTLVGAMCVVEWLTRLAAGRSVVVIVPTVTVQRQWVRELCYAPHGPQLAPHLVSPATQSSLRARRRRRANTVAPAVFVMTTSALATVASDGGRFEGRAVAGLLRGLEVGAVVVDEVHMAAERPRSLTASLLRLLASWRRQGRLDGLVGLSATARPFEQALAALGLRLVEAVDELPLVRAGVIAPFAEAGITFAYSDREAELRRITTAYGRELRHWLHGLDHAALRAAYASIPLERRHRIARRLLGLSARSSGAPTGTSIEDGLDARLLRWEHGGPIRMSELALVLMVQITTGWSDHDLATRFGGGVAPGAALRRLRREASHQVARPRTGARLRQKGFGSTVDAHALEELESSTLPALPRRARALDLLASTCVGVEVSLRDETRRSGEGRVHAIEAVIRAERAVRPGARVVVFERGGALHPVDGVATPGFVGVAGTFASLAASGDLTVLAVLPDELYLSSPQGVPRSGSAAHRIGDAIRAGLVGGDLRARLVEQVCAGTVADPARRRDIDDIVAAGMSGVLEHRDRIPTSGEVERVVLRPLRRLLRHGTPGPGRGDAPVERLSLRHPHLRAWLDDVVGHLRLALRFDAAETVTVRRDGGATATVEVVRFPSGAHRQLAHDVVRRLIEGTAEGVPTIDVVVVSSWARGGWDVTTPDVLIDATATRDPVAWQQLRGRALRPARTWTSDRRTELAALLAGGADDIDEAARFVVAHDKVAHVYELLKATGSRPQVQLDDDGTWRRIDVLAAKHRREAAVDLVSGRFGRGDAHAGIVVAADARADSPVALERALAGVLVGADERIVRSWLDASRLAAPLR